jgi:hypothetical protein
MRSAGAPVSERSKAAEQGEQHGHEIALAKRHQVFHLEHGE